MTLLFFAANMSTSSSDHMPTGSTLLHDRKSFPPWYLQLEFHCKFKDIWSIVYL
jgi:hypothetical protein